MNIAAAIFVDGLIDASWLFIVAVGLTLVFGVLNILNFAHGSLFAVGAYTAASAVGWYYGGKDRKSTRLNSSHRSLSRMPSSA